MIWKETSIFIILAHLHKNFNDFNKAEASILVEDLGTFILIFSLPFMLPVDFFFFNLGKIKSPFHQIL